MKPFTALHTHSSYSLLDGGASVEALVRRVADEGQPALAITDHGNMHGAWHFQKLGKKYGVKPILGMEAYVAPGSRFDRGKTDDRSYHHLVVLARDAEGYQNLCKLTSRSYTEGFYIKPRIDRELLAAHSGGLIVTSACMAGEIARALEADNWAKAREVASFYANVFPDRYYLEVQAHGTPGQAELNQKVFTLAAELGLPVVATNDAHFLSACDHKAHDALICIGMGKNVTDTDRLVYDKGLYFKSGDEMAHAFPTRPDVLDNTMKIADEVNIQIAKQYHVPNFPVPVTVVDAGAAAGVTEPKALEARYLRVLVAEGLRNRYGHLVAPDAPLPAHVLERAEYELGVIETAGYCGYFLIVSDFIGYARSQGIPVGPGRGSGAGSIVAYATEITDVCPLEHDLLFERFLNPSRVSMPDVDVDFDMERRAEVIEYVRQKYGKDAVAQIATFGTLKARAAITDVGRVFGFTPSEQKAVASLVPNAPGVAITIAEAEAMVPALRELAATKGPRYGEWLDTAKRLEGLARHIGVHAAGVVIAPGPVENYVPVCTVATKGAGASADGERSLVTQYEMGPLEEAGMLKMDFLGLTNLTVCRYAVDAIKVRHGVEINLRTLPLKDAKVFEMLGRGDTAGVFQFESPLATETLRSMRADCFEDLVASNALLRPGPLDMDMHKSYVRRKRGEEAISYLFPELEPVLAPSLGILTYQEQVMRAAQVIAGFTLGEADILRKAVGKKDAKLIEEQLGLFVEKGIARGFDADKVRELAELIEAFGRYGFNRSHSVAYSVISFHTAYLKAHYPAEFWAAMLTAELGKKEKVIKYMAVARAAGLTLSLPDVNESGARFTVVGPVDAPVIRFPLNAIAGVGDSAAAALIAEREAHGPYTSYEDFVRRAASRKVNKKVIGALVDAGALDGLADLRHAHRAQVLATLDAMYSYVVDDAKSRAAGQGSLFDLMGGGAAEETMAPKLLPVLPWGETERLVREHRAVGCFLSGHPLEQYLAVADALRTKPVAELGEYTDERQVLPAVIVAVERKTSKRTGNPYAEITFEDHSGQITGRAFADTLTALDSEGLLEPLQPLLIVGGYSERDAGEESPTFMIDFALRMERVLEQQLCALELTIPSTAKGSQYPYSALPAVLQGVPGKAPVWVVRKNARGRVVESRTSPFSVRLTQDTIAKVQGLLGHAAVTVQADKAAFDDLARSYRRRRAA